MSRNKPKTSTRVAIAHGTDASVPIAPLTTTPFPEPPVSENGKKLSETALAFLYKEYDILKDLYIQAEQTKQSIFNFYLTLITTITGGIVILMQVTEKNALNPIQSQVTVSGMLFFATVIGSVYLSSITSRYAHIARYTYGMDQIRQFLMDRLNVPLPPVYQNFSARARKSRQTGWAWSATRFFRWLFPTGTYVLFIAAYNSLSLALGVGLLLQAGGVIEHDFMRGALIVALIFGLSFLINNIYSQLIREHMFTQLNIQFDSTYDLEWGVRKQSLR